MSYYIEQKGQWYDTLPDEIIMREVGWLSAYKYDGKPIIDYRYVPERTCHDLSGTGANGEQVFHCSECGCVMSLYDLDGANVLCTNHIYDYPRYCPNCGARIEVVE